MSFKCAQSTVAVTISTGARGRLGGRVDRGWLVSCLKEISVPASGSGMRWLCGGRTIRCWSGVKLGESLTLAP